MIMSILRIVLSVAIIAMIAGAALTIIDAGTKALRAHEAVTHCVADDGCER